VSLEEISTIAWVVWLALILIFLVLEIFTLDFTFLMLAVASIAGVLAALFGVPWFFQLLIVGALAIILLFAVRPPLIRALRKGADETPSNVEALIGLRGTVSTAFIAGSGHVKLSNGETWTARLAGSMLAGSTENLVLADPVVVVAIEGATAVVAPLERKAQ
jgi:membrane protein implicated in regulation of membrane protease activity